MPCVVCEPFKHCQIQNCLCLPPDETIFIDIIGYMYRCALKYWSYNVYGGRYQRRYVWNSPWSAHSLILDRDNPACINTERGLCLRNTNAIPRHIKRPYYLHTLRVIIFLVICKSHVTIYQIRRTTVRDPECVPIGQYPRSYNENRPVNGWNVCICHFIRWRSLWCK